MADALEEKELVNGAPVMAAEMLEVNTAVLLLAVVGAQVWDEVCEDLRTEMLVLSTGVLVLVLLTPVV